jgi:hypothetical protein
MAAHKDRERVLLATKDMLAMINAAMVLLFASIAMYSAGGQPTPPWMIAPLILLVFVPMVWYFIRLKRLK